MFIIFHDFQFPCHISLPTVDISKYGAVCRVPALYGAFGRIPSAVKVLGGVLFAAGLAGFLFVEGCIISGMTGSTKEPVEYLIVLGAQVKGTRVSKALSQRLDRLAKS